MQYLKILFALIVSVGAFCANAFAEEIQLQRVKDDFVSPWIVSIEGGTLVLAITGVTRKSDNLFGLDASFGFIGTAPKPVDAEVQYATEIRQIKFTTTSGIRYHVRLKSDGSQMGTHTGPRGSGNVLTFEKVTERDLQNTISLGTQKPELVAPDKNVPTECSPLSGSWKGNWNGDANLWITDIDKECVATYVYAKRGWRTKGSAKIQNQKITFQAADAVFEFAISGQKLKGAYQPSNAGGRAYAAEFAKE